MVIGLTGGIASGKSTVSKLLHQLGAYIIDADQIARQIVKPHQPAWQRIVDHFGKSIVHADGTLNRSLLGKRIFEDATHRQVLNNITHPLIRQTMQAQRESAAHSGHRLIVMDIPLLYESDYDWRLDKIVVVYVPEDIQVQRLMARDGIDYSSAQKKIQSQVSLREKKEWADAVIDNSGTVEQTRRQVVDLLAHWKIQI